MIALWKRILIEKRVVVIPLTIILLGNIAAYALWVYPLGVKSATAAERAAAASQSLHAAEQEIATFYDKVLPADFSSARRLTYTTLPSIARKASVKMLERREEIDKTEKDARLGILHIQTQWEGDYEGLRRFIYELESDPAFVIIDDVQIAQQDPTKPLMLRLLLSTYYRQAANGN